MKHKKIVVVGSINLDLVATVARLPRNGETISGQSFATFSGGKGANQAVCAARLGGHVSLIGRLGRDSAAAGLRRELEAAGVDTSGVTQGDGPSGTAVILVTGGAGSGSQEGTAEGSNSIIVIPGANATLRPGDLKAYEDEFRTAAMILAQLEIPLETVEELGRIAQRLQVPFVLDPAPAVALPGALLRTVTWLTPNETESHILLEALGHKAPNADRRQDAPAERAPEPRVIAQHLLDAGVRNVILKLGAQGFLIAGQDVAITEVACLPVPVVDTTAAGDAFNGGFAYALVQEGLEPLAAARFANAVAAISVTRAGAQSSMPGPGEVQSLLSTGRVHPAGLSDDAL